MPIVSTSKNILITGANRGLGLGFVKYYLEKGCCVVACFRNSSINTDLERLKKDFKEKLFLENLDVSKSNSIEDLVQSLNRRHYKFNVVINNAGICVEENIGSWKSITFDNTFRVNTIGVALFSQAMLPLIKSNGKLINISSGLGSIENNVNPEMGFEAYAMSKAALNIFTRRLASKPEAKKIIVIALSPGWVQTDMGGPEAPLTIAEAIGKMVNITRNLSKEDSGKFLSELSEELPW